MTGRHRAYICACVASPIFALIRPASSWTCLLWSGSSAAE